MTRGTLQPVSRLLLLGLLAWVGCSGGRRVAPPAPADDCFERYAPIRPHARLDCVELSYPIVPPLVVGPGRIRAVVDVAVPGVPAPRVDDEGAFVVDLTPTGQEFVATVSCPGGGDVEIQALAPDGAYHVLCRRIEFPEVRCRPASHDPRTAICEHAAGEEPRYFLDDLRLSGGRFTAAGPTLEAPAGWSRALVLPDDGSAFVVYHSEEESPMGRPVMGPLRALPWVGGAAPIDLAIALDDDMMSALVEEASEMPAAILIQDGRLRLVVGRFWSGWTSLPPEGYSLVEVTRDGARAVGQLHVERTVISTEIPMTAARDGELAVFLPLRGTDDEAAVGIARLKDTLAAAGPSAIAGDADLQRAMASGRLGDDGSRLSCGRHGCVAAEAGYDTFELRVWRWRR